MIIGESFEFPMSRKPYPLKISKTYIRNVAPGQGEIGLKHFDILSSVFLLLIGVGAILYFYNQSRRFRGFHLHWLLGYMIFFNFIVLDVFILVYFDSNLTPLQWGNFISWFKGIDWPLRSAFVLGMYVSLYGMIARLRGKKLPRWVVPAMLLFTAALMSLFLIGFRLPSYLPQNPGVNFWNLYVWPLNLLVMVWLFRMLAENGRRSSSDRRRSNKAFAWLFLSRLLVQLMVAVLLLMQVRFWSIALSKVLILYTDLIPIFWMARFFIPWAGSLGKTIGNRVDLQALQKAHGLSAREMEVLMLVLDGKSYKQIEESLFISIHTVKSHVYSLYRKMKLKSRHQLIHKVSTFQENNS
jgi:DNA-binding CsgD family transcriptional regulator